MKTERSQSLGTEVWWLGLAIAISLVIYFLVPFPASLLAIAATFMIVGYLIPLKMLDKQAKMDTLDIRGYCLNCGIEHNSAACPDCGSKAIKLDFDNQKQRGNF